MSNVEFSSVEITKALHGGIKGASKILGESEQDFIHSTLAFAVGKVVKDNFETVHLYGESVEDDTKSLRRYFSLRKEGKKVRMGMSGTRSNFENISKAMELVWEELGEEEDVVDGEDEFRLFFQNIGYEEGCSFLRMKRLLSLSEEGKSNKETELIIREEQAEYRTEKGYLASEIPPGFTSRFYQSIVDPHLFLSQVDLAISLAQEIDAGNFTIRDVILFVIVFRQLGEKSKKKLEDFLGKKRMDRIKKLVSLQVKDYIIDKIDEGLDVLEAGDVEEDGDGEEEEEAV